MFDIGSSEDIVVSKLVLNSGPRTGQAESYASLHFDCSAALYEDWTSDSCYSLKEKYQALLFTRSLLLSFESNASCSLLFEYGVRRTDKLPII